MGFLSGFMNIHALIAFLIGLIPSGFFIYKLVSFIVRKEIRIFKNLKRKVYLFKVGGEKTLEREFELIKQNNLYVLKDKILDLSKDLGILETVENSSIFVVGYSTNFSKYRDVLDRAKRNSIPVILLANPGEIKKEHMEIFNDYPYSEMCNTSARLLTTIFNLSVITPNEKN